MWLQRKFFDANQHVTPFTFKLDMKMEVKSSLDQLFIISGFQNKFTKVSKYLYDVSNTIGCYLGIAWEHNALSSGFR